MPHEHEIVILPDGTLHFIYYDELKPLLEIGKPQLRRASHVDPTHEGDWHADLSPVGGPKLGPFDTREEAITAEVDWLIANRIGKIPPTTEPYQHVCQHCGAELEGAGDFPAGKWWWECPKHGRKWKS